MMTFLLRQLKQSHSGLRQLKQSHYGLRQLKQSHSGLRQLKQLHSGLRQLKQSHYGLSFIGLLLATSLLYLLTVAPSVVTLFDDSLEFQLVTYQLGIAHPTGYPLYTLLGHLFTYLPLGNVAYRVNLMSAVFGVATVMLLFDTIRALSRQSGLTQTDSVPLGSVSGAALLAVSGVFWQQATIAEVYTLNALFVMLIVRVAVSFQATAKAVALRQSVSFERLTLIIAALFGLSLTHHRTMVLLIPAVGLWWLLNRGDKFWKPVLSGLIVGAIPLLLYLYLPLRGHVGSLDGNYIHSWTGFWQHVTASGYGAAFLGDNPFGEQRDFRFYWELLTAQFGWATYLGLLGWGMLAWRRQFGALLLTSIAALTYTTFNLFYNVSDIDVFFIPVFLMWAIWSGLGVDWLMAMFTSNVGAISKTAPIWQSIMQWLLILLLIAQVGYNGYQQWQPLAERNSWQVHDYGLDILQQPLPPQANIVGILGEMTLIRYFQQTENLQPNWVTWAADTESQRWATIESLLATGETVYLTRPLAGLAERYSLSAVGPLIKINPQPQVVPPPLPPADIIEATPQIRFVGAETSYLPHSGAGLPPVRLTVAWQVTGNIERDLKVSARLLDSTGEVVAVTDVVPVRFAYPTNQWRIGEIVVDAYDMRLSATGVSAGHYRPLLIWYDPHQGAAEVGRVDLDNLDPKGF